ncbi:hypothetical protein ACP4OV_022653 [Aristida adscensionis]
MRVRAAMATVAAAAAALLMLVGGGACAMHKVGNLDAWGIPPASKPDVYVRWGNSTRFKIGDSIWFLYPPSQDSVVQVTARALAACDVASPLLKLADGNSVFNLTAPGRTYYTSGKADHCRKGQKLAVNVPMANGTYVPPTADDLAALAALAPPPSAQNPDDAYSAAFAPDEDHPGAEDDEASAASLAAAGAGSVLAAAAALAFALLV